MPRRSLLSCREQPNRTIHVGLAHDGQSGLSHRCTTVAPGDTNPSACVRRKSSAVCRYMLSAMAMSPARAGSFSPAVRRRSTFYKPGFFLIGAQMLMKHPFLRRHTREHRFCDLNGTYFPPRQHACKTWAGLSQFHRFPISTLQHAHAEKFVLSGRGTRTVPEALTADTDPVSRAFSPSHVNVGSTSCVRQAPSFLQERKGRHVLVYASISASVKARCARRHLLFL